MFVSADRLKIVSRRQIYLLIGPRKLWEQRLIHFLSTIHTYMYSFRNRVIIRFLFGNVFVILHNP